MKSIVRKSLGIVSHHTPMSVRRALGPTINPLVSRLFSDAPTAPPPAGVYTVRPYHTPTEKGPRVLHVIGNFLTGGSSRLVVDLYERLGHRYVQRVVAQVVPNPPAYIGIPVQEINQRDSCEPLLAAMRAFRPDLVHVHYWGDCDTPWYERVFEAARIGGYPIVENVNTPVAPFVAPGVVRYVYVSEYVRSIFGRAASDESTIYPGSDFGHFKPPMVRIKSGDRVGMVYRLEPDKLDAAGIEPMIGAARLDARLRFVVVGGGTFFEEYRARVAAAGFETRFEFPGYVAYELLPAWYRNLAVFVAPVWKESFGQVSAFAMNMGVPVVGYDVGAIGEIVGDSSLLAPPGDSEALARIIVALMHDERRRRAIGARNRERAQKLFSVEAMASAYDRLYREQLGVRA